MISKKCKYAIKALLYIADHQTTSKPIFISEIAENENIPKKFLESILLELKHNKILTSKRGKNGGYSFLKKLDSINITDIIRIVDGPIAMLPCVSLNYYEKCEGCDEHNCTIKKLFEEVRDCTLNVLNNSTIQSLIKEKK